MATKERLKGKSFSMVEESFGIELIAKDNDDRRWKIKFLANPVAGGIDEK